MQGRVCNMEKAAACPEAEGCQGSGHGQSRPGSRNSSQPGEQCPNYKCKETLSSLPNPNTQKRTMNMKAEATPLQGGAATKRATTKQSSAFQQTVGPCSISHPGT